MRTPNPRPNRSPRGIGTLIGNGWLREASHNAWPRDWDLRGRSALRKCVFLPGGVPGKEIPLPAKAAAKAPVAAPPPSPRNESTVLVNRREPNRDRERELAPLRRSGARPPPAAWYEDPVALGSLLILMPPIGLAALWSSKRYSNDARWALTVMTALMMCIACAIALAVLALR